MLCVISSCVLYGLAAQEKQREMGEVRETEKQMHQLCRNHFNRIFAAILILHIQKPMHPQ